MARLAIGAGPGALAPNGREIFFFDADALKVAQVSPGATFTVERVTRLFTMSPASVTDYAPGPDGRFLFLGGFGSRQTHLLMLSDWRRLLPAHSVRHE